MLHKIASRFNEDDIRRKDVELEKLQMKFLKHLQEKMQWPKYVEHSKWSRKERISSDTDTRLYLEQERHFQEKERLKGILREKEKQLESLRIKIEMSRRESKESNEVYLRDMDDYQKSLMKKAIERFDSSKQETMEEFQRAKEILETRAQEDKIQSEESFRVACEAFKRKLQDYYKEVTKQDFEMIKNLKQSIRKVERNIIHSRLQLEKAQNENKDLKVVSRAKTAKREIDDSNSVARSNASPFKLTQALKMHVDTEKLSIENQNLLEQINDLTEKTNNLRRQFTSTLRKVRESAEVKSFILEKKLNFISEGEDKPSDRSSSCET